MIKKISNLIIKYKCLYKGELVKKIHYKVFDILRVFYIKTIYYQKIARKITILLPIYHFNVKKGNIRNDEKSYYIFGCKKNYNQLKEQLYSPICYFRNININSYEDIKLTWEANRLQILMVLAMKYLKTNDENYKKEYCHILDEWIKNNPFEFTVQWNSNLEVAIRLVNIAFSLLLLADETLNHKYKIVLYLHTVHVYNNIKFSLCCIPNNHVIGEAVSLLFLANIIDVKENNKWKDKSLNILNKYVDFIEENGYSREHSFSYQFFITKMFLLAIPFISDKSLQRKMEKRILSSISLLNFLIKDGEDLINYGDNDSGFFFSIQPEYSIEKDIKDYYNYIFNHKMSFETQIYEQLCSYFNFSINHLKKHDKLMNEKIVCTKELFIARFNNCLLFFNAKDTTGHAHNDSLAINLYVNGSPVFLEAGTYNYNKNAEIRKYYRGRGAHNTLQFFNDKNAPQVGNFRWLNRNQSYISSFSKKKNGYKVIGVISNLGSRMIDIDIVKNEIAIIDEFEDDDTIIHWIVKKAVCKNGKININDIELIYDVNSNIEIKDCMISDMYNVQKKANLIIVKSNYKKIKSIIKLKG